MDSGHRVPHSEEHFSTFFAERKFFHFRAEQLMKILTEQEASQKGACLDVNEKSGCISFGPYYSTTSAAPGSDQAKTEVTDVQNVVNFHRTHESNSLTTQCPQHLTPGQAFPLAF